MRVLFLFIFYGWLAVEDGLLYVLRTTVPVVRSCRNVVLVLQRMACSTYYVLQYQ